MSYCVASNDELASLILCFVRRQRRLVVLRSPELTHATTKEQIVTDPKYAAFKALDPFFNIVQQGLAGLVDGDHYFDTIAEDAVFEFRYHFPGWPQTVRGRDALMALYAGYGNNIVLDGADELVVHRTQDPRVLIIEYDVHGKIVATGSSYDNRFISVVTIEGRKIVQWRDYMDSLAAMTALSGAVAIVRAPASCKG
jgi:ketosteroid isomerase-like protein